MSGVEDPIIRSLGEEILEKVEQAFREYQPVLTIFYDSHSIDSLMKLLNEIEDMKIILHGGYKKAVRKRLELRPLYYLPPLDFHPVRLLEICGDSLQGRDHLYQTILSSGIDEGFLGDLLSMTRGYQLVVVPEIVEELKRGLMKAYRGPMTINEVESLQLERGEDEGKEFPATVASMRLDSIASAGFGTSRSRMKREIVMEKVKLNWRIERDPSQSIGEDDIISMEGRGRLEIRGILGKSRRGRVKLLLKRYS